MKDDAAEGLKVIWDEVQAVFNRTLVGVERAKIRRSLYRVEEALQERYQEVGEKIFRQFTAGEDQLREKDFTEDFSRIEHLLSERQRILDELKGSDFSRT